MIDPTTAAYIFCVLTFVVVLFQLALALGAPWGELAMGGKYPGRFPPQLRFAASVQAVLLLLISFVVLTRSGLVLDALFEFSRSAIWFVVAFCVVGAVLNVITPSKRERMLWAPVTIVLLFCAAVVAWS